MGLSHQKEERTAKSVSSRDLEAAMAGASHVPEVARGRSRSFARHIVKYPHMGMDKIGRYEIYDGSQHQRVVQPGRQLNQQSGYVAIRARVGDEMRPTEKALQWGRDERNQDR